MSSEIPQTLDLTKLFAAFKFIVFTAITPLLVTSCLSRNPPDNPVKAFEGGREEVIKGVKANPGPAGAIGAAARVADEAPKRIVKDSILLNPNHPMYPKRLYDDAQQKKVETARLKAAEVAAVENAAIKNQNEINRRVADEITTPFDPGAAAIKAEKIRLKELEDYYKENPNQRALDNNR